MAAVLIVAVFFIFSCSLQALYANMVLIRNPKIKILIRWIIYQRAFHFSTFSRLVWLRIQVLTFTHPSFIHDNSSICSWSEHAGNQSAPLWFLTKNRNRQLQTAKQNTKKKNKKLLHTAAAEDVSVNAAIAPVWSDSMPFSHFKKEQRGNWRIFSEESKFCKWLAWEKVQLNDAGTCYRPVMCIKRCTSRRTHTVKYLAGDWKWRKNQPVTFTLQEFFTCSIYTWSNSGSEKHHVLPWHEIIKISRLCKVAWKTANVWKEKEQKQLIIFSRC